MRKCQLNKTKTLRREHKKGGGLKKSLREYRRKQDMQTEMTIN